MAASGSVFNEISDDQFILEGDAVTRDGVLVLTTPDVIGPRIGRAFWVTQIHLYDQGTQLPSFHTSFTFNIVPKGSSPPADGIAFFIADPNAVFPTHAAAGSLGIFDSNGINPNLFAVEFSTPHNKPGRLHLGIDINRRDPNPTKFWGEFYGKELIATITYGDGSISVNVVDPQTGSKKSVSRTMNLSFLPKSVLVGFSASSGNNIENHVVYNWSFPTVPVKEPPYV